MAKIFSPPEDVGPPPKYDFALMRDDFEVAIAKQERLESEWLEKLRTWVKQNSSDTMAGEIIGVGVADGMARYMVLTPSSLIHLPLGDAYQFRWANRWTAKDVREMVHQERIACRIFGKD